MNNERNLRVRCWWCPIVVMRPSREFVEYQTRTSTPQSDYTSIGSTRDSVLRHAELGTVGGASGEVPVVPSYVFYLYRSDFITSTIKSPSDCVVVSSSHTLPACSLQRVNCDVSSHFTTSNTLAPSGEELH